MTIQELDCKIHDLEAALVLVPESDLLRSQLSAYQNKAKELLREPLETI